MKLINGRKYNCTIFRTGIDLDHDGFSERQFHVTHNNGKLKSVIIDGILYQIIKEQDFYSKYFKLNSKQFTILIQNTSNQVKTVKKEINAKQIFSQNVYQALKTIGVKSITMQNGEVVNV